VLGIEAKVGVDEDCCEGLRSEPQASAPALGISSRLGRCRVRPVRSPARSGFAVGPGTLGFRPFGLYGSRAQKMQPRNGGPQAQQRSSVPDWDSGRPVVELMIRLAASIGRRPMRTVVSGRGRGNGKGGGHNSTARPNASPELPLSSVSAALAGLGVPERWNGGRVPGWCCWAKSRTYSCEACRRSAGPEELAFAPPTRKPSPIRQRTY
jgi:hypothetical protein